MLIVPFSIIATAKLIVSRSQAQYSCRGIAQTRVSPNARLVSRSQNGEAVWLHETSSRPCKTKQDHCRVLFGSGVSLQWCIIYGCKNTCLYKCDVLESLTSAQIDRTSCHHMLRSYYLKQKFENPRNFISLKIISLMA